MATASVRVRLVVEVSPGGGWGDDCTIGQAKKQGTDAAIAALKRALGKTSGIRIVDVAGCDVVLLTDK